MGELDRAIEILVEAEESLSALMREDLEHQWYDDVAAVADVAQRFSDFIRSLEGPRPKTEEASTITRRRRRKKKRATKSSASSGTRRPTTAQRASYPRFRRDGDRLVKVGWSRKRRQEYEHRTPIHVVWTFATAVRKRDQSGPFTMDDLLPLVGDDGKDLPSYQAYLALAWMRNAGVITKNGRDGYRADTDRLDKATVSALWDSVPPLGSERSEEAEDE